MSKELYKIIEESKGEKAFVLTSLGDKDFGSKAIIREGKLAYVSPDTSFFQDNLSKILEIEESGIVNIADNRLYVEQICNNKKLVICGAGHVSVALIKIGRLLGFEIIVIEDREEFANRAKEVGADRVYCEEFGPGLRNLDSDYDTYYVIVTRGHQWDRLCIREILKKPYAYVGLMGSKRRVGFVLQDIKEEGFNKEQVDGIYTPIGININSETPEEIAISILGEIISVKNTKKKNAGYVDGMLEKIIGSSEKMLLSTIIGKKGSAPREIGAKALFIEDGSFIGTVGGGKAEYDIYTEANKIMKQNAEMKPFIMEVNLTDSEASLEGMVCGGRIEVLLEPV